MGFWNALGEFLWLNSLLNILCKVFRAIDDIVIQPIFFSIYITKYY